METNITTAARVSHTLRQSATMTLTNLTVTPASNESRPCEEQRELQSSLAVLYTIIFIPGLICNLLALWVFVFLHTKNSIRVFLINIALADLLLMVCLPFKVLYHSQGNIWRLGSTLCTVVGNLFYMNMYISITLLGMISVDRYLKIHRGVGIYRMLSTRGSSAACALTWTGAVAFIMPMVLSKNPTQTNRCFYYKQLLEAKWKAYLNIAVVVAFWIVFITLVTSYVKLGRYLRKRSQGNPDFPSASHYKRTAKKSFVILLFFSVCFVPYHLVRIFYIKTQITDTSCFLRGVADKANEITLVFSALNSCLDPVMYFLLSSSMRREVLRLAGRVLCLRDAVVSGGSSSNVEQAHDKGEIHICSIVTTATSAEEEWASKTVLHVD